MKEKQQIRKCNSYKILFFSCNFFMQVLYSKITDMQQYSATKLLHVNHNCSTIIVVSLVMP